MADRLLFMLTDMTQHPIQEVQGQLFGMSQSNAHKWIHLLHTVFNLAFAPQDVCPARTADELAMLLTTQQRQDVPTSPLVGNSPHLRRRTIARSRPAEAVLNTPLVG
jgi:hypothetical protein